MHLNAPGSLPTDRVRGEPLRAARSMEAIAMSICLKTKRSQWGLWIAGVIGVSLTITSSTSSAIEVIDFEDIPGAFGCMTLSDQFEDSHGVRFRMSDGGFPKLAEVGGPKRDYQAFQGPVNTSDCDPGRTTDADMVVDGQAVGCFFLTDADCDVGPAPKTLVVDYVGGPVSEASGDLMDIDANEMWAIVALDSTGAMVGADTLRAKGLGTGDGLATQWSIDVAPRKISSIEFRFIGSGSAVGVAFDNFSPASTQNCELDVVIDEHFETVERGETFCFPMALVNPCRDTLDVDQLHTVFSGPANATLRHLSSLTLRVPPGCPVHTRVCQPVPSTVPIGRYRIRVDALRDGVVVNSDTSEVMVE